ncbi:MAG: hypothetical protein NVSMB33_08660 [Ktedonobacteraceae bacterium]
MYFTTGIYLRDIVRKYHLRSEEALLELAKKCLMQHQDGTLWGFRALLPGVTVIDHPSQSALEAPVPLEAHQVNLDNTTSFSEPAISLSASSEQLPTLVDEAVTRDDEDDTETAKREAVRLPQLSQAFKMDVPETPLAVKLLIDEEQEREAELAFGEQPTVHLREAVSTEESPTTSELEWPVAEDQLIASEENVTIEPQAVEYLAEPIVAAEPGEQEQPTTRLEDVSLVNELPTLAEQPIGSLKKLSAVQESAIEEQSTVNLEEATASEQSPTVSVEEPMVLAEQHTPLPMDDTKLGASVVTEAGATSMPSEAEEAIAEAERIIEEKKEPRTENGYIPISEVESEKVQVYPHARVTTPLALGTASKTSVSPLVVPFHSDKRPVVILKRTQPRRMVRKRWQRVGRGHAKPKRAMQTISIAILAVVILFVLLPLGAGLTAYGAYNNINGIAHDGINHLLKVKAILNFSKSDPTAVLDVAKLKQAQVEFQSAESDFDQLQQLATRPDVQNAIAQFAPQYGSKLGMVQCLVQVALDVSRMGKELSGVGLIGANIIHGSPLAAGSTRPLISAADMNAIEGAMVHALYYISDIRLQMSHVSIKDLPVSAAQKTQLSSLLPLLPKVEDTIKQAQGLTGLVAWLLGVGHQRRFLVQTMDRGELRPGGGFTGQYGILELQDGRMAPFNLVDVTKLDYGGNGTSAGRPAPPGYSWMNFGNWGLRDSNLSGDFPTTARMTMQLFQDEGGGPVDGDIAFTPALIELVLNVIGPVKVPGYNETITSSNLEERLHYYQQDFTAIAKEKKITGSQDHSVRKAFTSTLGKILLDRVRHLKPTQLLSIAKEAPKDILSHDLEIYFTNPAAEAWLVAHGYSGSLDTFSKQDGFAVTQANISISKATQYVHTTEQDNITLDAQGGASHQLTITLDYKVTGPIYGNPTYADYIRVYAPKTAQFVDGYGFDSGHALCRVKVPTGTPIPGTPAPTSSCSAYDSSFGGARYCPNGNYALGLDGMLDKPWTVDSLGPPTVQTSDLPDRSMWGGLTETPQNCISTITVSWYVPDVVKMIHGQPSYTIIVQKQGGIVPTIELNIDASAIKGLKSLVFNGDIVADKTFTLTVSSRKK